MRGLIALLLFIAVVVYLLFEQSPWLTAGDKRGSASLALGDYQTALQELQPLARQGNANAQFKLAQMYRLGEGIPQDNAEAAKWYGRAAKQGDSISQYNLGRFYAMGEGVPKDVVMAYMWFNLAAASGFESAVDNRYLVERQMSPAQISEAQSLSREWLVNH